MKKLPPSLRALGRDDPPSRICVGGNDYRLVHCFKHDFFACTSLYEGEAGKIVLKQGRVADICGLPARWIGRLLAHHEAACFNLVDDLDNVPTFLGRWGATGIVHEFVEGEPLSRDVTVPDRFFDELEKTLDTMHARRMAYVDLEKRQNVLVAKDGQPVLIDFQISWHLPAAWGGDTALARWIRRRLQDGDRYHLLKLRRRYRRDQLSDQQLKASYHKPFWIRLHARVTSPITRIRRHTLNRIDPTRRNGERGAVTDTTPPSL